MKGGVVPFDGNDVVIADSATVTVNATVNIAYITVGQGTSGILTFDGVAARAVAITGNITVATNSLAPETSLNKVSRPGY